MTNVLLVDAFTDTPFGGNPAAVCLLDSPAEASWMQSVAMEFNQSETAFVWPQDSGVHSLRWFTPRTEVDLCGHATLASAHALWSTALIPTGDTIRFETASGNLLCRRRSGSEIELDFPALPAKPDMAPLGLLDALGLNDRDGSVQTFRNRLDIVVMLDDPQVVRELEPDFRALSRLETRGVMVTSRCEDESIDFISRFFAPAVGIDEDPVTGSAHCCLGPLWSTLLGKENLVACQVSARGGRIGIEVRPPRVHLIGSAVVTMKGRLADSA